MAFKSFTFLDNFEKRILKEAEETENENTNETPEEGGETDNQTGQEVPQETEDIEGNPETTPDVDKGGFISDLKKAEWTKLLLSALMSPPPTEGVLTDENFNVTTENADTVIDEIRNAIMLKTADRDLEQALNSTI